MTAVEGRYSLTGKYNELAPAEATGLELDKLTQELCEGVDTYLDTMTDAVGPPG